MADFNRRLLDLETACHDLKLYVDQRTPNIAPGDHRGAWRPPVIQGKDQELDGVAPELMSGADLP